MHHKQMLLFVLSALRAPWTCLGKVTEYQRSILTPFGVKKRFKLILSQKTLRLLE